jgi:O-antigen ligase
VSAQAIADSPILGHGSWARDATYVALLAGLLEEHGVGTFGDVTASSLIPSHSHLLGSWVEAGILGGLFWILILVVTILAIYKSLKYEQLYFPFVAFSLVLLDWDILFSPLGGDQRFLTASRICVALFVLGKPRRLDRVMSPVGPEDER